MATLTLLHENRPVFDSVDRKTASRLYLVNGVAWGSDNEVLTLLDTNGLKVGDSLSLGRPGWSGVKVKYRKIVGWVSGGDALVYVHYDNVFTWGGAWNPEAKTSRRVIDFEIPRWYRVKDKEDAIIDYQSADPQKVQRTVWDLVVSRNIDITIKPSDWELIIQIGTLYNFTGSNVQIPYDWLYTGPDMRSRAGRLTRVDYHFMRTGPVPPQDHLIDDSSVTGPYLESLEEYDHKVTGRGTPAIELFVGWKAANRTYPSYSGGVHLPGLE